MATPASDNIVQNGKSPLGAPASTRSVESVRSSRHATTHRATSPAPVDPSRDTPSCHFLRLDDRQQQTQQPHDLTERDSEAEEELPRWQRMVLSCCPSWLCGSCRHGTGATDRDSTTGRLSSAQQPSALAEDAHLKHQVDYYSQMRVHMKRVQLCLEQEKRNEFYKELLVYLIFLIMIISALLSLPVHFPYEQNAALDDLFFDEEFRNISIKKNFYDIMVEDELWQWVEGPLLDGYYDIPVRNNKRIGSIMIRSGRVRGKPCLEIAGHSDLVLFDEEMCYPSFSKSEEMKQPYGSSDGVLKQPYTWSDDLGLLLRSQTFNPSLINWQMDYGDGGYAVYLPRSDGATARAIVEQLKDDFLTDSSRYFVVNFAFFNPRSDIFTHIQALFELSDTDYIERTKRVKSFRIFSSYKESDFVWDNLFLLVLILASAWLVLKELTDIRENGLRKYFQSLWNILDMVQLILLIVFLERWIAYLVLSEQTRTKLLNVIARNCDGPASDQAKFADCFVDMEPLAWHFYSITNYAAALALVSVAIVFKYLRLNTRLNLLWRTLRLAAKDLVAFVVIFFTIFFGFAVMGFLIFGSQVRHYHSLTMSLASSFQMLLGAFDYNEIYNANPAMAGLFFFSFMISVYLICINMFIAIMSEYYSVAQEEKRKYEENKRNLVEDTKKNGKADDFTESYQLSDVEYDILKQIKKYISGLTLRVRMLPLQSGSNQVQTEQVALMGEMRVLLVDYNYLTAERKRLRAKFRSWVHHVTAIAYMARLARPDFTMTIKQQFIPDVRHRAPSDNDEYDEAHFPVVYLPIASAIANPVEILKRLKPGMLIDMDDGSLTKDQITLEVLGGQEKYVPENYRREVVPHDPAFDVLISESSECDEAVKFGLQHAHSGVGEPSHIRCCRVKYHSETIVDGMEACLFPKSVWVRYFFGYSLREYFTSLFANPKKKKRKTKRLVTDAEVDELIRQYFTVPGRGISCRYDELRRNFRMLVAKKVHKRHMRISNLENRIEEEVISFLERFPSALTPLDKRELEGYKYTPQPVDTRRVRLPNAIHLLTELLSQNAHEVWAVGRISQGWKWGPQRDNEKKLHPDLIPYEDLTEETKQYDRDTSIEALKVITALGYILEPPSTNEEIHIEFGEPADEPGGTYVPKPIPTDDVRVPPHLRSLVELLAENTHEVWAKMRMGQGWKFGPQRDDEKKEHNGLVPYIYLTNEEKQMDRNTSMQTVKVILRCGFTFVHKDKIQRARKRGSGSVRVFGRNENPEAKNVGEAVSLARGATRAKQAFLRGRSGRLVPSSSSYGIRSLYSGTRSSSGLSQRSNLSGSIIEESDEETRADSPTSSRHLESSASSSSLIDSETTSPRIESLVDDNVSVGDNASRSGSSKLVVNQQSNAGDRMDKEESVTEHLLMGNTQSEETRSNVSSQGDDASEGKPSREVVEV